VTRARASTDFSNVFEREKTTCEAFYHVTTTHRLAVHGSLGTLLAGSGCAHIDTALAMRFHGTTAPILRRSAASPSAGIVLASLLLVLAGLASGLPQTTTDVLGILAALPSQFALVADSIGAAIEVALLQAAEFLTLQPAPELYWAYGRSPPVYPSRESFIMLQDFCCRVLICASANATGLGGWAEAYSQAKELVGLLTLEEKASLSLGSSTTNGCSGFIGPVAHANFPGLCLNDAESGVRNGQLVSGYPAQIHVGASWNRALAYDRAHYIGREFKAKGINMALGPVVGPLGRIAKGGRNWEGFSNDPYLAGSLVYPTIVGIQESVIACVKHFIANEQETNRQAFFLGFIPGLANQSVSSNVDDRAMHELYLWPFYDAIRAEPGSVMCSYNRINGSHACQNSKALNGLLKTELGFQGFVVSDWYGAHTGIAGNEAGLDMVMPSSQFLSASSFAGAVNNGSFDAARLDDQATRILAPWYRYAKFDDPGMDDHADVDARDPASQSTLFQSAVEGHVLVKNLNQTLPLQNPKVLSLFGYDAIGGSNSSSDSLFQYGLANSEHFINGAAFTILDEDLNMAAAADASHIAPEIALDGTMNTGAGSGAITPTTAVSPYDAFLQQAATDGTTLYTDFKSQSPIVRDASSPCIVFINAQSPESWDRRMLQDGYSDTLVTNVASQCHNTIVVIHNAGVRLVDNWIDHPNITAVIFAHLPGQESGNALVELMYGRQSPSGRLPYTVAHSESDYGALLGPDLATPDNPFYPQSDFTEGLMIDYKHFINEDIQPRFAFGFGTCNTNRGILA
jgi:beta-glucosidase